MGQTDFKALVQEYMRQQAGKRQSVSAVGAAEHLHIPIDQAVAVFNELEAAGKVKRVDKRMAIFELPLEEAMSVVETGRGSGAEEGSSAAVPTTGTEVTEKEEDMVKVSFETAKIDWTVIRSAKSFAKLGFSGVSELLERVDKVGLEKAVPVGPNPGNVNSLFRKRVAGALAGLRQHAVELDKLPPKPARGRGRPRIQKAGESRQPEKPSPPRPERLAVGPTTFRHPQKAKGVEGTKAISEPAALPWELVDLYADMGKVSVSLRKIADTLNGCSELEVVQEFLERADKLPDDQKTKIFAEFSWMLQPARKMVEAVQGLTVTQG